MNSSRVVPDRVSDPRQAEPAFHQTVDLRRAGWCLVVDPSAFTLALCAISAFAAVKLDLRPPAWFVIAGGAIGLAVYGAAVTLGTHLLRTGGALVVTLSDGRLVVRSPSRVIVESFSVNVSEIVAVVCDMDHESDMSGRFSLLMASGEQHWLPENLDVDMRRLMGAVVRHNPGIIIRWRQSDGRLTLRSGDTGLCVQRKVDYASRSTHDTHDSR